MHFNVDMASDSHENFISPFLHIKIVITILYRMWQLLNGSHNTLSNQINNIF